MNHFQPYTQPKTIQPAHLASFAVRRIYGYASHQKQTSCTRLNGFMIQSEWSERGSL